MADFLRVELRDDDELQTQIQRHVEARDDAVAGEHRDDVEEPLIAGIIDSAVFERDRDCIESVVAEHDALRETGGASGHGDGYTVVLAIARSIGGFRIGVAGRRERLPVDDVALFGDLRSRHFELFDKADHRRHGRVDGNDDDLIKIRFFKSVFQLIIEDVEHQDDPGAGALDERQELFLAAAGVQHERGRAQFRQTVQRVHRFGDRDRCAGNSVSGLHAELCECGCRVVRLFDQLAVRDLIIEEIEGDVRFMPFVSPGQSTVDRLFRYFCVFCLFTEKLHPGFFDGGESDCLSHFLLPFSSFCVQKVNNEG